MPRTWWRNMLIAGFDTRHAGAFGAIGAPAQAPFFMLVVLVLSVCEQVHGRRTPGRV